MQNKNLFNLKKTNQTNCQFKIRGVKMEYFFKFNKKHP